MGKMKTLQQYINEDFRISHKTKINECFVYKLNEHSISKQISIFGSNWEQFDDYKDKVYDDKNRNIKLTDEGLTKDEYSKGKQGCIHRRCNCAAAGSHQCAGKGGVDGGAGVCFLAAAMR